MTRPQIRHAVCISCRTVTNAQLRTPRPGLFRQPQNTLASCFSTSQSRPKRKKSPAEEAQAQSRAVNFSFKQTMRREPPPTSAAQLKSMYSSSLPHDLGLLAGTLIMPSGSSRLKIWSQPALALSMEVGRIWKRVTDLVGVLTYKFYSIKPMPKLKLFKTTSIAKSLHETMYSALAEGDVRMLDEIACEGLYDRLSAQISQRPRNWTYLWTVDKYLGFSRVISHRATMLPIKDATGQNPMLRQAVVKIRSRQSLKVVDEKGFEVQKESVTSRPITEYVVVQKRIINGQESEWKLWGTIAESKIESRDQLRGIMKPETEDTPSVTV